MVDGIEAGGRRDDETTEACSLDGNTVRIDAGQSADGIVSASSIGDSLFEAGDERFAFASGRSWVASKSVGGELKQRERSTEE